MAEIFDEWPEKYDQWFETPIGSLVKEYEGRLLIEMLRPAKGEHILDVGCGTGVFTSYLLAAGSIVTGLELSLPMLRRAGQKAAGKPFSTIQADMQALPFFDSSFDKTVSITAIEFLEDARSTIDEFFRVTRPGGLVAVATLNSLSPWATRRKASAQKGHPVFKHAKFRSPSEMADLSPFPAMIRSAVHFQKDDNPETAKLIESKGAAKRLESGAFLLACWEKPRS